jgi:hypothetical protein
MCSKSLAARSRVKPRQQEPPIPQVRLGRMVRRTIVQLEKVGEIHQPRPTNYADRTLTCIVCCIVAWSKPHWRQFNELSVDGSLVWTSSALT